jgi:release factor glutamine methyltransferase
VSVRALEALHSLSDALGRYGVENPRKEAEIIFTRCMGMDRVPLYRDNPVLRPHQIEEMEMIVQRRQRREPLQYIVGRVDFFGLAIKVGPGVLIPRPETELMVEEAIKTVTRNTLDVTSKDKSSSRVTHHALRILDLCTGSGCIALALAKMFPQAEVSGTDISEEALAYARMNAGINDIRNVTFLKGDLFEPVKGERFDLIISNPPYIRRKEIDTLQPEIKDWEPLEALDGGEDGLRFHREILSSVAEYLLQEGSLIMELGQGEACGLLKMSQKPCVTQVSLVKDYSGIERILRLSFR